jgi:hypothetical protein
MTAPSIWNLSTATLELIEGVYALLDADRAVPLHYERARRVLKLCRAALAASKEACTGDVALEAATVPHDTAPHIAGGQLVPIDDSATPSTISAKTRESTVDQSIATLAPTPALADLGRRIAELRFAGKGVRQIARELGVNPSTVSRRLRGVWRAVDRG